MRGTIIAFLRVGLGVGIFATPYYTRNVGILNGIILIFVACLLNSYTYYILFKSLSIYKRNHFKDLVSDILGPNFKKLAVVTFSLDFCSTILINCITGWNIFLFLLLRVGVLTQKELKNPKTL